MEPISYSKCLTRLKNQTILVTGGAGFIGSHLVDRLLEHGARVIVLDDRSRPRKDWPETPCETGRLHIIDASILDHNLDDLMQNVQVVYHLAAVSRVMDALADPERAFSVNLNGTVRIANAAERAGVRRLVFGSSREVYGNPSTFPVHENSPLRPINVYGISKAAAEMYLSVLNSQNLETVILRLSNVYGPGDRGRVIPTFIQNALQGKTLFLYGGKQVLDLVWIDDVVRVLIMAGFSGRPVIGPVNVGSGVGTPIKTLAERILSFISNGSDIQLLPSREVEVERFQAGLQRAGRYFGLTSPADPLVHLESVIPNPIEK